MNDNARTPLNHGRQKAAIQTHRRKEILIQALLPDLVSHDAAFVWFPRRESPAYYDRLMHECFRGGLRTPHIVQEAVNEATILSLVSCRLGVAFVSSATRWRQLR